MYNSEDEFEPESGAGETSKPWLSKSQGSNGRTPKLQWKYTKAGSSRKKEHNQTGNESKTGSRSILNTGHINVTGFHTNSISPKNETPGGKITMKKEKCLPDPTKPIHGIKPEHTLLKTTIGATAEIKIETGADSLETARFSILTIASRTSGSNTLGSRRTGGTGESDKSGTHGESSKQRTGSSNRKETHGESSKQRTVTSNKKETHGESSRKRTEASDRKGTHGESSKQRTGASDRKGTHGESSKQRTGASDRKGAHGESSRNTTGESDKSGTPVKSYRKRPEPSGDKDIKSRLLKLAEAEGDVYKGRSKKKLVFY